jgi:hypothetical protein
MPVYHLRLGSGNTDVSQPGQISAQDLFADLAVDK